MKLYGYFISSTTFRVRIALNLKGIDAEYVFVDPRGNGEHRRPEYIAVNPQALIPSLADGERVVTQSLAIIEYLDETRPEPPLLPATPAERARVRSLAQVMACDVQPLNNRRVLAYLDRDLGVDEEAVRRWFGHWTALGLGPLEARLARDAETGRFCHGDAPGLADVCLVPQIFNARLFDCDLAPYPTLMRVFEACMGLEAFERARPERQPDADGRKPG